MTGAGRWPAGEAVTLRYITRDNRPGMSWPFRVVADDDEALALFIPRGAVYMKWSSQDGARRLVPGQWRRDTLRLMFPGEPYSIWLAWEATDAGRHFSGYYVNLEEPFRRTEIGVDTNDHTLDIVVTPDLKWRWKDEDEFQRRLASGIYSLEFGGECRACALRVVDRVEARAWPFDGSLEEWTPEPGWPVPQLTDRWDQVQPALWPRRRWAYGDAVR